MNNTKFVLRHRNEFNYIYFEGYYTGKNYIFQGSKYAIVDKDILRAKVYSNRKRAEKACEIGFENYSFEVVEIQNTV